MAKQQQVVIVGGGVIGLLTAYNLASEGQAVTLLERGGFGQESSWAGGGIVSPLYPWRYSQAVTALAHWSQDFYPNWRNGCLLLPASIQRCILRGCIGSTWMTKRKRWPGLPVKGDR